MWKILIQAYTPNVSGDVLKTPLATLLKWIVHHILGKHSHQITWNSSSLQIQLGYNAFKES
jgi:hypothetical protein